ncbi:MAG: crossover junction endodeoxyribonuclease RuvC [candidate division Zixibacteria bacterium]|nr:crossover junction endodeoxyribonuclease RuvC [candidate division Zixibacteria bacterium]
MLVLGIDPGLRITGYGLVEFRSDRVFLIEGGVVRSEAKDSMTNRVGAIFNGIDEVIKEFKPDVMAMEEIYSHIKHPKTAIIMAQARGAILAAAFQSGLDVTSYPATTIKSSLTGNGRAKKEQLREMVFRMLHCTGKLEPVDTYDALAAALCHINQHTGMFVS